MVSLTIDGIKVTVPENTTVLEAARQANIHIPTLCYLKGVNQIGACRMCLVEVKGGRALQAACVYPVSEGMEVYTNNARIRNARKVNLELILSNHDRACLTCVRNQNCELQSLAEELGIREIGFDGVQIERPIDTSSPSIVRDPNKCILCRRCVATCQNIQKIGVIGATNRGFNTIIEPVFDMKIGDVPCVNCGQCIMACPVGALREKDSTQKVWDALADPTKHVVVQPAPAVRVALGEEFGMPMGTVVTGKLAAALRKMGFDAIFDTNYGADLTIMEEASELIERVTKGGKLPMITSCSPGWVKFCEHFYPEFLDNLSTCKSPHEMLGAIIKSYYAQKQGIDPKNIVTVSVMPCVAKKFEAGRDELSVNGLQDVDLVITTRELARMIKEAGINFPELPDEDFDPIFGDSTGAAAIFGATGGVMEAALRTAYEFITGGTLEKVDFEDVRGIAGVKEATVKIGDMDVKVAVASGTGNARKILDAVKAGEKDYHFIEVMGCPGGCVTGGGQPIVSAKVRMEKDPRVERAKAIYSVDKDLPLRKSHENPSIKKLYDEYLEKPGSHRSHELLHTHYVPRKRY
ncbi:NADH-dependent [FeFe] hydrogenase, group A6 [Gehongia tenuis]|uniref:Iron hydrogenase small subunit n=1 Tax=Gehongia tenuis TaxID=2763655 RepID=A0A926D3L9_9FIRM|nr:NADH-dependent [FeFe] hydrogenase, group A6 [Gehongia tenuis]MBC8530742.1 iron hydrogenase small subunit [Gehongia tenuis]